MNSLLLDTNVVVWLLLGDREAVPEKIVEAISARENRVSVSAVSVWEIAIKRSLGRLEIEKGWNRWWMGLDFNQMPITAEHAAGCEGLPWHHRDPFDRMLIAQAMSEHQTIVSADRSLGAYEVEVLW